MNDSTGADCRKLPAFDIAVASPAQWQGPRPPADDLPGHVGVARKP